MPGRSGTTERETHAHHPLPPARHAGGTAGRRGREARAGTRAGPHPRRGDRRQLRRTPGARRGVLLRRGRGAAGLPRRRRGLDDFETDLGGRPEHGGLGGVHLLGGVQATRSNYTEVHRSAAVKYIDHFVRPRPGAALADVLQSASAPPG
ncbi:NDP-hexose 2,3-dehydratase family protein [Streptomyces goshikiensis]|uniref:NDP-hexose 2,3-dehydratase family protein n=1 Tax=Streptomyces goshikiensis TaxID=1942 RepID=UPI003692B34F